MILRLKFFVGGSIFRAEHIRHTDLILNVKNFLYESYSTRLRIDLVLYQHAQTLINLSKM